MPLSADETTSRPAPPPKQGGGALSWPNRITIGRLLMVPVFILLYLDGADQPVYRYAALGLAAVIGILDAVDGQLARRTGRVSRLGSVLDPLADKSLMIAAFVLLSLPGHLTRDPDLQPLHLPYWASVPIISRELVMVVGAAVVFVVTGRLEGSPSVAGKAATVVQFVTIVVTMLAPELIRWMPAVMPPVLEGVWAVAVALAIVSLLGYVRKAAHWLGNHDHEAG